MATQAFPLEAFKREKIGTRATRRLRSQGNLPGVIYGHQEATVSIAFPAKAFNDSVARGAHVFELGIDGQKQNVLVKDVQYDHLGTNIVHVDFFRVDLNEEVEVTVSIDLKGTPAGAAQGGKLQQVLSELEIRCKVTDIPDSIVHNVSNLELDAALHVSELSLPEGVVAVTDPETVVAVVHAIVEQAEPEPAEGAAASAEPEVIKKEKAADEPAEGEKEKKK